MTWLNLQLARLNTLQPLRMLAQYNVQRGPVMAAGIGFTMFFSITGLLTTGFSIAALVLKSNKALLDALVSSVAKSTPGLLKVDGGNGLVDPQALLNPTGLGWTAIIAALVTIFTALSWIASLRIGMRGVAGLQALTVNPVVKKLKDAGTLVLLGVALLITAGVTVVFGGALDAVTGVLHLDTAVAIPAGFVLGVAVALLLNWLTATILFKLAAGLELDRSIFVRATALAGVGMTILQLLSGLLLGKATANPLLASFVVIIGLLIWFNFVSQVFLFAAAYAAVRQADADAAVLAADKRGRARTLRPA
ncbi:YihY/virulence factor BrkB family protein [Paeniglutamicibacter antarcticus]|uniref:YihY/virulence factor BrkB family protein n=1 Tax=Arthrobacter terrae TaxID=2935737 RepID=A0A931CTX4_9MICC|nr:YihY/virulence factor BrkB family protein [Arthrobacter terrae]MBG0739763.1 YihY/virulence factor BrkB family protein [Arthrobacter terrae]